MDRTENRNAKKLWLASSVFLTIGLLLYFKYANFFMENANYFRGFLGGMPVTWKKILLPIGISFFSFQSLTYTMDVYRKVHAPLKNPLNYLLYIVMFPQLIAGPIVRFQDIADQIVRRKESWEDFVYGFIRFSIGLGRKVLIADVLGLEVDKIMQMDFSTLDSTTAWLGIIGYTFQLYFDFSRYSDMAIGLGRMMGFKFPENFNNPYTAESISKFWRKWHMTFSNFMRDYLYIPLGGSRVSSQIRLYFNLWIVFFLSGLWHGASWNFVLWGIMHGVFIVLERIGFSKVLQKIGKPFNVIYTFFIASQLWLIFRIESLSDALNYYHSLFSFDFHPIDLPVLYLTTLGIGAFFSFITLFNFGKKWGENVFYNTYNSKQLYFYFSMAFLLFVLSVSFLSGSGFSPFIYFRF